MAAGVELGSVHVFALFRLKLVKLVSPAVFQTLEWTLPLGALSESLFRRSLGNRYCRYDLEQGTAFAFGRNVELLLCDIFGNYRRPPVLVFCL